jgi:hypothetical protein
MPAERRQGALIRPSASDLVLFSHGARDDLLVFPLL